MTNTEFVNKLLEVRKYQTKYAKGTFGQRATDSLINQKAKQYPKWYTDSRIASLKALSDDTRLFDCVGLIKGVMWGFPNIIYTSNGVKDYSDQSIWEVSTDKSYDFAHVEVGELLWLQGHVGVYIGEGKAIECTTAGTGNVQITAVSNIGQIAGLRSRKWTTHSKLPFIVYNATEGSNSNDKPKVDYSHYPTLKMTIDKKTGAYTTRGEYVKIMQKLLFNKGCNPNGIDGVFGKDTNSALKKFQSENTDIYGKPLVVDCICGQKTWGSLYK